MKLSSVPSLVIFALERSFCGVVTNVLDYDIVVSEFELQSRYYVHFRTNTLRKDIDFITPSAKG